MKIEDSYWSFIPMSVVPHLRELHSILGSWPEVENAVKIDQRHRRRITNEPGFARRVRSVTRERIAEVLEERRPFPLSDYLRKAREVLTELKASPGSRKLETYVASLDGLLNAHDPSDQKLLVEYKYMRMMACMSKALHRGGRAQWFGSRKEWAEHLRAAQANAEEGMKVAGAVMQKNPSDEQIAHLHGFLFINWIQIIQEQAKAGYANLSGKPMSPAEKENLFRSEKALERLKVLMGKFPYLWQAAYNGLEQASSLREDQYALWFYNELKRLDPGFQDFDYSPGEVAAISAEPGMAYFHAKFREQLHTPKSLSVNFILDYKAF
jgi:hypothetical protein